MMSELDQRLEETGTEIRANAATLTERPLRRVERSRRSRTAVAVAGVTIAAVFIGGAALWLGGASGDETDGSASPSTPTTPSAPTTPARTIQTPPNDVGGVAAVKVMLAVQPTRAVTAGTDSTQSSGTVDSFPYLVLDIPEMELFEAFDVTDGETDERIGIETVYNQWWENEEGDTVGREILLRVQDVGQEYPWLTLLSELAESTETVRIGDRDVTVYMIPDEAIEEGTYDLGVLHWIEEPGVEAILIPWGLDRDGALDLMAGLQLLDADEWLKRATSHDPTAPATTTTVVSESAP